MNNSRKGVGSLKTKNIKTQLGHKLKNIIIYDQNTTMKICQGQE
jgi:hypothetical protein